MNELLLQQLKTKVEKLEGRVEELEGEQRSIGSDVEFLLDQNRDYD